MIAFGSTLDLLEKKKQLTRCFDRLEYVVPNTSLKDSLLMM